MTREIANADLTEADLPPPNAEWHSIGKFSLSFNGFEYWGSFKKCGDIANRGAEVFYSNRVLSNSLSKLRTCLFFEQRRWNHFGYEPDEQTMDYIHALVQRIREKDDW